MSAIQTARRILEADLPKGVDLAPGVPLTPDIVLSTFSTLLVSDVRMVDATSLAPNASRARGLPHLPAGVAWPTMTYLAAQLDLASIASFGLWPGFPDAGIAYLFFDPSASRGELIRADGPGELAAAPAPEALPYEGKYYQRHFFREVYALDFSPRFALSLLDVVPERIVATLERELGYGIAEADDSVVGGEPCTYQGESAEELLAPPDWDWSTGELPDEDGFLLFQDHFGEGHAHFWVDPTTWFSGGTSDLRVTYSGT